MLTSLQLDPAPRRRQLGAEQHQLAELAHRTGEPVSLLRRLPAGYRQEWLVRQRQEDGARARAEITELRELIARAISDHAATGAPWVGEHVGGGEVVSVVAHRTAALR